MENTNHHLIRVNTRMIIGRMAELGYNKTTFAAALGIGRNTLDRYLNTPANMPYGVIVKMVDLLCDGSIGDARRMFMDLAVEVKR